MIGGRFGAGYCKGKIPPALGDGESARRRRQLPDRPTSLAGCRTERRTASGALPAAGTGSQASTAIVSRWRRLRASSHGQGKAAEPLTVQADLTSESAADEITKATSTWFRHIEIIVNNAEIGPGSDHGAARAQLS
jgi:NAD(P)-dependent dehydrogenase (short-subunit alcohol dehydrogenase family)